MPQVLAYTYRSLSILENIRTLPACVFITMRRFTGYRSAHTASSPFGAPSKLLQHAKPSRRKTPGHERPENAAGQEKGEMVSSGRSFTRGVKAVVPIHSFAQALRCCREHKEKKL